MKPQTTMFLHIPANPVLLCYLLAAQPLLVCMLGYIQLLSYLYLGWLSHCYILFVDDMIIINVDYIRRRMEGLGYPAPTLCSIRVT